MIKRWILMTVISVAVAGPAWAQTTRGPGQSSAADLARTIRQRQTLRNVQQQSPVQRWLDQNVASVSFDETLFEDVIRWLREQPGEMNIVVEWAVMEGLGVDREAPVTLELKNVPLYKVLGLVLKQVGQDVPLGYQGTDNILTITLEEELNQPKNFVIRAYPVTQLIRPWTDYNNAPSIRLSNLQQSSSGGGAASSNLFSDDDDEGEEIECSDRAGAIVEAIVDTIEPESWSQNGGSGSITFYDGAGSCMIIVNNSPSVHEKLGGPVRLQAPIR